LLTNGRKLFTLRDAATYITSLPKADQQAAPWQIATEMLLLVAEHGGDTMMPRIAMMKRCIAMSRRRHRSHGARPRRNRDQVICKVAEMTAPNQARASPRSRGICHQRCSHGDDRRKPHSPWCRIV
jgi:hypothetical protein